MRIQQTIVVVVTILMASGGLIAASSGAPPSEGSNLYSLDLEGLLNVRVTTASKFSEDLSKAPGVMTVITQDELQRFGGTTLKEVLARVPGLFGSTASFTDRSIISFRGDQTRINGGHILYLINGRPTREVLEGGIATDLLESFPVSALDHIEVIKGPGSVLYGSNAFSGVVNLITRNPDKNGLVLRAMGAGDSASSVSGRFSVQRGSFRILGAGEYHARPSWGLHYHNAIYGDADTTVPDRADGAFLEMNYRNLTVQSSWGEYRTAYVEGFPGQARWRRGFADVGYRLAPAKRWDMSFNFTFTRTALEDSQYLPFISRDSYEVVGDWSNTVQLGSRDRLTFGASVNHMSGIQRAYSVQPPGINVDGTQSGVASYAQLEHNLRPDLQLVGGVQVNKITALIVDAVPRGGLIWNPAPHWTMKALYSQAYRAPSLHETWLDYRPPAGVIGPTMLGDSKLAAEKIATVDLAATYQNKGFQGTLDYFHSRMDNRILLGMDPRDPSMWSYRNVGRVGFQGVEAEGKYYAGTHILLTASAIGNMTKDQNGNRNVTPIPNFGAKAGISYRVQDAFTAGLFDAFDGPIPGYSTSVNPTPAAFHLLSSDLRLDISRVLPGFPKGIALVSHGENLLNHPVWLPDWPDNPGNTIFVNRGRTVYAGFEFSLGRD